MKDLGRLLVLGVIPGVGFRVVLMQGMTDDIFHPRLWLLHEGLELLWVLDM
jgi:hypothetical protein